MSEDLLTSLIDRFKGSALGAFVGDAMGREVEGWSWEMIRARYGILQGVGEGIYTDDTEMMIGIMESLQENLRFDPALTARRFLENFHPFRGYGSRIYGVMARLRQGTPWDQVGTDSWGNGGAMRIAPIGFFFYDDREKLKEVALLCTQITHRHSQGLAGAQTQAQAVGMATEKGLSGEAIDHTAFLEEIAQGVQEVDPHMAAEIERIKEIEMGGDLKDKIGQVAFTFSRDVSALGAVPAALASFLLNEDFRDTVVTAVNCGGDTDTIGAMAGAIAGAYYGFSSIPSEWLSPLENGEKGRDYVATLAEELARIKARGEGWI
ncbi:MAG: ADP-ribosylglycohydrolase family protein [Deltaproteobacteria bacterium]|nr:ADP-ribosylglycohydrolase family protein [Deltaproteobacteria bacterium]